MLQQDDIFGFPRLLVKKRLEQTSAYFRSLPEERKELLLDTMVRHPKKGLEALRKAFGVKSSDLLVSGMYHGKEGIGEWEKENWKDGLEDRTMQEIFPLIETMVAGPMFEIEELARKPALYMGKQAVKGLFDVAGITGSEMAGEHIAEAGYPITGLLVSLFGHALATEGAQRLFKDATKSYAIGRAAMAMAREETPASLKGIHKFFAWFRKAPKALKLYREVTKNAKDISELDRFLSNMEYLSKKYPEIKPFYARELQRIYGRHEDFFRLMHGGGSGALDAWGNWKLPKLNKTEREVLNKIIQLGDTYPRLNVRVQLPNGHVSWRIPEEQLRAWGVSDNVIDAYNRIRNVMDNAQSYLLHFIGKNYKLMGWTKDEAGKIIRTILKRPGYFPRIRPASSSRAVWLVIRDSRGKVRWREPINNPLSIETKTEEALKRLRLNPKHASVKLEPMTEWPEGAPFERATATSNVGALLDNLVKRGKVDEDTANILRQELENLFAARGYGQHFIRRAPYWIGGYEEDAQKVLSQYIGGLTGYAHKVRAAKDYASMLLKMDALKNPKTFVFLNNYVRRMLENTTKTDKAFAGLRQLAYAYHLAGKPAFAVLNMTQNLITAHPYLAEMTRKLGVKGGVGLTKAMSDAVRALTRKTLSHLSQDEAEAFRLAMERGVIDNPFVKEMLASETGAARVGREIGKVLSLPISATEYLNRGSTFLAAYRIGRRAGMDMRKAWEMAAEAVRKTQFQYGKANLPLWASTPVGKTWLTLRQYTLHLLNLWREMLDEKSYKALLESIGMVGVLGGLSSYPFVKMIKSHLRRDYGIDIDSELKKAGVPEPVVKGINKGVPALIGIDMSPSLAIDIPFADAETARDVLQELMGPGGAATWRMAEGIRDIISGMETGDQMRVAKGVEKVSPAFVRNPLKAIHVYKEGEYTKHGIPITNPETGEPYRYSEQEAALRALGFVPESESELWEKEKRYRDMAQYSREWRQMIYEMLRAGQWDRAFDELARYNDWALRYNFRPVDVQALRRALRGNLMVRRKMMYPY